MTTLTLGSMDKHTRKREAVLPAGWWLLPSVIGGALIWVKLGMMAFG